MLRRPLIGLTVACLLGAAAGLRSPFPPAAPLAFATVCWVLAALALRGRAGGWAADLALVAAVAGLGWTRAALAPEGGGRDAWPGPREGRVAVLGTIANDPECVTLSNPARVGYRFTLRVEAIEGEACPPGTRPRVTVSWFDFADAPPPRYGERWAASAKVRTGRRSGRVYLEMDGRRAVWLSAGHGHAFAAWCYRSRRRAAECLTLGIADFRETTALLHALLLGYRQRLSFTTRRAFAATGTLHVFAISGLHVGILTLLAITFLRAARVPRAAWVLVLGPLLAAYALGTGARASAIRAALIAGAYFAAPLLGRRPDGLSALALAALLIVAAAPGQVRDVGFILSFVVVLGLMLLYPRLRRTWAPRLEPDPLRLSPESRARRRARGVLRAVAELATLSVCAWTASVPLGAYFFGRVCPVALPANMLVVPLAYGIVLAGGLSLLLGPLWSGAALVFNHANLALMALLAAGMDGLARTPLADIAVPPPPLWAVWLWYAALGALVVGLDHRLSRTTSASPAHAGGRGGPASELPSSEGWAPPSAGTGAGAL
jgi:ComEC/Rec2-related protein